MPESLYTQPLYLMAKPVGAMCNMKCEYCYYLEKRGLYAQKKRTLMDDATLEAYIRTYIEAAPSQEVQFTWHGGEATMMPLDFYKRALKLQQQYGKGKIIANSLQTNGMLLTDDWCRFLHDNGWLVGVSIDGPKEFHDEYRRTPQGYPSFDRVMHGINLLNKHRVEWNAMAVVNDYNADFPEEFYNFFKDIQCHFIQFTPIVERVGGSVTPFSVSPEQWGDFLCRVFDLWVKNDVGQYFVQIFDATLANWVGVTPGLCTMDRTCGHAAVMEHNGDVYCCDHFVSPDHKLGNVHTHSLVEMMMSPKQQKFGLDKHDALPRECKECKWLFACNGECPKNRFVNDKYGNSGKNFLCPGYKKFFNHVAPAMDFMKNELNSGRPPANILKIDDFGQFQN